MCAQSALDFSWMDRVDTEDGVFITAEGLLMYLQPTEAMGLITECAQRFPGGQMMFDLPPSWFAAAGAPRHADLTALPGAADAVQPVGGRGGKAGRRRARRPRRARPAHAPGPRPGVQRGGLDGAALPLFDPVRPAFTLLEFG